MMKYFKQNKHLKELLFLLAIFLVGLFAMKALFHSGFYTSHDGWHQVARLYHYWQLVSAGQFPPRYSLEMLFGYGYPLFIFSYHAPWLLSLPFLYAHFSIFDVIKIIFVITFIASGITMYVWVRKIWGNLPALVSAIFYIVMPYRLATVLVRAALGEAVSFMFIPLLFYSLYQCSRSLSLRNCVIGSIAISGLVLSHTMIVFLLLPLAVTIAVYEFATSKFKKQTAVQFSITFIIGFLLSAFYLLPAFVYQRLTIFADVQKMFFQTQYLTLKDLFYSPWGYSATFTGVGQMSLQLGLAHWLVLITAVVLTIITIFRKLQKKTPAFLFGIVFLLMSFILLFLTHSSSKPLWELFKSSIPLDFPWRMLSVLALTVAVTAGYSVTLVPHKFQLAYAGLIIIFCLVANRNHLLVNQYTEVPLDLYIKSERTTNTFDEYLPRWAQISEVTKENRIPYRKNPEIEITNYSQTSTAINFRYKTNQEQNFELRTIYFPGLVVAVNNNPTQISYKDRGFINFKLPKGEGTVSLRVIETTLGIFANGLTILGIFISVLMIIKPGIIKKFKLFS